MQFSFTEQDGHGKGNSSKGSGRLSNGIIAKTHNQVELLPQDVTAHAEMLWH